MPTLTIEYQTDAERLILEQVVAHVRGMNRPARVSALAIVSLVVGLIGGPVTFCLNLYNIGAQRLMHCSPMDCPPDAPSKRQCPWFAPHPNSQPKLRAYFLLLVTQIGRHYEFCKAQQIFHMLFRWPGFFQPLHRQPRRCLQPRPTVTF